MSTYEVILIREGMGNPADRNVYTAAALEELVASGRLEGLPAYADHPTRSEERDLPERSVRGLVGQYRSARLAVVDGLKAVVGKFIPITGSSYSWVKDLVEAAIEAGRSRPLVGISLEGNVSAAPIQWSDGRTAWRVTRIEPKSGDIVTQAGAGGGFLRRLSEGINANERKSVMDGDISQQVQYLRERGIPVRVDVAEKVGPPDETSRRLSEVVRILVDDDPQGVEYLRRRGIAIKDRR